MAILTTGNTFSTGQQVLATSLNAAVNNAAFAAGAIDVATMQFVGTNDQIGIKDSGVSTAKIAALAVTGAKIAETTITPTKLSAGAPAWTTTTLSVTNSLDFAPVTTAAPASTYGRSGTLVTVSMAGHGMVTGNVATLAFSAGTGGTATNGAYPITVTDANTFTITDTVSGTITGTPSVSRTNYYGNATIRGSESVTGNLSVTGNTAITGSATVAGALSVTGALSIAGNEVRQLTLGTAQSPASPFPTAITFASIPSWAKRITLIFNNVSTSGTANYLIQLADSGGVENTGYASTANNYGGGVDSTEGFIVTRSSIVATGTLNGTVSIYNAFNSNLWISSGVMGSNSVVNISTGSKTLSSTLTGLNILTVGGTNTFDAGSINIMYEG
jgi:hypothetical protein